MISLYYSLKNYFDSYILTPKYNAEEYDTISNNLSSKRIIEMSFGEVKIENSKSINHITCRHYNSFNFLPLMIFKFLNKFGVLFNLLIISGYNLFEYDHGADRSDRFSHGLIFISYFIFFLIKNMYCEYECYKYDIFKNNQKCQVKNGYSINFNLQKINFINGSVNYEKKLWKDLQIGDIILLKRNEKSPADLLIFDLKDRFCQADTRLIDGKSIFPYKSALNQTSFNKHPNLKSSIENYIKIFCGKIVIDMKGSRMRNSKSIKGFIKLNKDPKIEIISSKNIFQRESELVLTDWLIGMVIFIGEETSIAKKGPNAIHKTNYFEEFLNKIIFISIVFIIIFSAFSEICNQYFAYKNKILGSLILREESYSFFFLYYSRIVSLLYYFYLDITSLIEKNRYESFYKKEGFYPLKIRNPDAFTKLKQLGSVVFDKNRTLTNNELSISGILFDNEFLAIKEDDTQIVRDFLKNQNEIIQMEFEKESEIPDEDVIMNFTEKPNLDQINIHNSANQQILEKKKKNYNKKKIINKKQTYNFQFSKVKSSYNFEGIEYLNEDDENNAPHSQNNLTPPKFFEHTFKEIINSSPEKIKIFFQTLLLCHITRTKYNPRVSSFLNESLNPEDHSIFNFCEKNGCNFKGAFKVTESKYNVYELSICSKKSLFYPVLGTNEETGNRKRISTIIGRPFEKENEFSFENSTLYVKGEDPNHMLNILKLTSKEKTELIDSIEKVRTKGFMTVIYAKKNLEDEETRRYLKRSKIIKTSLTINEEELESLYNSIETNCELVCIVCFRENLELTVSETIKSLNMAKLRLFLVSGDNETSTLAYAFNSGIITSPHAEVFKIQVNNENAALISMKYLLQRLQKKIIGDTRFSLMKNESSTLLKLSNLSMGNSAFQKIRSNFSSNELCVVINGESLRLIYKNRYLRSHLLFLLIFYKFIIFDCSRRDKMRLIKLIKQLDHPNNKTTLAVGDGYDDIYMMIESDVSIEIKNKKKEITCFQGDIILDDFSRIEDLIYIRSSNLFRKTEDSVFFMFYLLLSFAFIFFLYGWFSDFSSSEIIQLINVDVVSCVTVGFLICTYFIYDHKESDILKKTFPLFYSQDIDNKKLRFFKFFLKSFLPAIFTSIITFFFLIFSANYSYGSIVSFQQTSLNFTIVLIPIFYFAIIIMASRFYWIMILSSLLFGVIFYLIISSDISQATFGNSKFQQEFQFNIEFKNFVCNIYIVLSCICINYILKIINDNYYDFFTIISRKLNIKELKGTIQAEIRKKLKNNTIMLQNDNSNDSKIIKRIVKSVFNINKMDIIVNEILNPAALNSKEIKYSKYFLNFENKNFNKKYLTFEQKLTILRKNMNICLFLIVIGDIIYNTMIWVEDNQITESNIVFGVFLFLFVLFIIICIFEQAHYSHLANFIVIISLIFYFILFFAINPRKIQYISTINKLNYQLISVILFIFFQIKNTILFSIISFLILLSSLLIISTSYDVNLDNYSYYWILIVFSFFCLNFLIIIKEKYTLELDKIKIFLAEENLNIEKKKINDVLSLLVPKFVKDLMYQGNFTVSEDQPNVIVLFADIFEFEKITAQEQNNLVKLLDSLYRIFDQLCIQNNVQKIETVGKTYMACAGLKECELNYRLDRSYYRDCAERIISLALEMMKYARQCTWGESGTSIRLKIGIHNGPVIAGIIGFHKPQFSLIGDTINTTSRICATSEVNKVTISESVFHLLKKINDLIFVERKVEAKGKGELITFQIIKRNKFPSEKRNQEVHNKSPVIKLKEQLIINKASSDGEKEKKEIKSKNSLKKESPLDIFQKKGQQKRNLQIDKLSTLIQHNLKEGGNTNTTHSKDIQIIIPSTSNENDFKAAIKDITNEKNKNFRKSATTGEILGQFFKSKKKKFNLNIKINHNVKKEANQKNRKKAETSDQKIMSSINLEEFYYHKCENLGHNDIDEYFEVIEENPNIKNSNSIDLNYQNQEQNKENDYNEDNLEDVSPSKKDPKQYLIKYNKIWLNFSKNTNQLTINEFEKIINDIFSSKDRINFVFYLIFNILISLLWFLIDTSIYYFTPFFVVRIIFGTLGLIYIKKLAINEELYYKKIIISIFYTIILIQVLVFAGLNQKILISPEIEILYWYLSFSQFCFFNFFEEIIIAIFLIIAHLIYIYNSPEQIYHMIWSTTSVVFLNLSFLNLRFKVFLENFNNTRISIVKKKQLNNLVSHLLPNHILEKFLERSTIAFANDIFENVTILFADIVNFTKYSSSVTPIEVVNMLRILFTEFDKLCLQLKVYKLYTIGDCYVVIGIVNSTERDIALEAKNTLLMGFAMIHAIQRIKSMEKSYVDLNMRIGIHTGEIIGGIVGTDIVRYDIYGKDVYIANKMESNSTPGRILISEKTYNIIKDKYCDDFEFEENKGIEIPGSKESMYSYFAIEKE